MPFSSSKSKAEDSRIGATDQAKVATKKGKLITDQATNIEVGKGAKVNSTETVFSGNQNVTITNTAEGAQAIAKDFISGTLALQQASNKALQDALKQRTETPDPTATAAEAPADNATPGAAAGEAADTFELFGLNIPRKLAIGVGVAVAAFLVWKFFFKK